MPAFRVMTWNVENLFPFGSEGGPKTDAEYREKLQSLAKVILELDPDVLGLQEVGSLGALQDLVALLQNKYPYLQISTKPDPRGIRVGFISKLEITSHEDIVDFPQAGLPSVPGIDRKGNPIAVTQLSRGALRISIEPTLGFSLDLINTHLKSKLLSFPSAGGGSRFEPKNEDERAQVGGMALLKRTAEAVALRVKANELLAGNATKGLIVLGDFNDVVDAATTQIFNGQRGSEIGSRGFDTPDRGDDTRLFNLAALIPAARRFSRIEQGNRELIDHIFVSQELLPGQPRKVPTVDSHVDIFGSLPSVAPNPGTRLGKPASDHAPITATFEL